MNKLFFLILFVIILFYEKTLAQVTPSNNQISFDVSTYPQNSGTFNYDSCFTIGKNIGMNQVGLFQNWTSIETAPNTYNFFIIDIANYYYPLYNMSVDLTITPIHTNNLEVPSDLTATSFSNPIMINRFKKLLDSVKLHAPNLSLSSLIIGSEHDVYMGANASLWSEYKIFYDSVSSHAKVLWPGLKVATELTFNGITSQNTFAQLLNANSDYIGVSHYPLNANFTVKPPANIANDFSTIVSLYPTKPICFYQFGYPSSSTCNSSDALQKDFIIETFASWDNYASNIRMIDFTWLHDLSAADVAYYGSYYGITNTAFLEFLRTLGFREWTGNGTDKPALDELRCQAKQRGFNNLSLNCNSTNIAEESKNSFSIFPNPAKSLISFSYADVNEPMHVKVYNVLGELMISTQLSNQELNIEALPSGIYLIQLNDKKSVRCIKE